MPIRADGFLGSALRDWWDEYQSGLLASGPTVASGYVDLPLSTGGAAGSFWFNANDGQLLYQFITGDFDIAVDLQALDEAGTGLPPATGDARLVVLAAHDPDRTTVLNYVHRGIGRAPGGSEAGDGIVDEWKTTVNSVSTWDTFAAPNPATARAWVRMRRVGDVFTSWTSTDGVTWANERNDTRADLPAELQVGLAVYSSASTADLRGRAFTVSNVPIVDPNALPFVSLAVDGVTGIPLAPTQLGPDSAPLSAAPYLLLARGNLRSTSNLAEASLELRVGGTAWARMASACPPFGVPAYGALSSPALQCFALVEAAGAEVIEFFGSDSIEDGIADVLRAIAVDLTTLEDEVLRFHGQSANSNAIVTTPSTTVAVDDLTVTIPRAGDWILFVSAEYVPDGTEAATDLVRCWVTEDGTPIPGSTRHASLGFAGTPHLAEGCYAFAAARTLTAASHTFALVVDGGAANGNVGWRRFRFHLLDAAAFAEVAHGADATGLVLTAPDVEDAAIAVSIEPPQPADYLVLTAAQGQYAAWPRSFVRDASHGVDIPIGTDAAVNTGVGVADDLTLPVGMALLSVVAETELGWRTESAAGGTSQLWGAEVVRTDDGTGGGTPEGGPIRLVAIRLATPPTDVQLAAELSAGFDLVASLEAEVALAAEMSAGFDLAASAAIIVSLAATLSAGFDLRIPRESSGSTTTTTASILESAMSDLTNYLRSAGARGGAAGTLIDTSTSAAISPVPNADRGHAAIAGYVSAADEVEIELWDGEPEEVGSTLLCSPTLAAGEKLPLSVLAVYSSGGRALWIRSSGAVDLEGRAITIEV